MKIISKEESYSEPVLETMSGELELSGATYKYDSICAIANGGVETDYWSLEISDSSGKLMLYANYYNRGGVSDIDENRLGLDRVQVGDIIDAIWEWETGDE
jgi:hypothetical protein